MTLGQQVWIQCENEIDDATQNRNSRYWRGTMAQYLSNNLAALYQTARSLSPPLPVVLTSFSSENLDLVSVPPINSSDPSYIWQTNFFRSLLNQGTYDVTDLHFYGYATNIPAKINWLKSYLPPHKLWISTENGGPDSRVAPYISWTNSALFESTESNEVPERLDACLTNNAAITMWFSLYDFLPDTNTIFGHLGLILPSGGTNIPKPAYYSYRNFTATH